MLKITENSQIMFQYEVVLLWTTVPHLTKWTMADVIKLSILLLSVTPGIPYACAVEAPRTFKYRQDPASIFPIRGAKFIGSNRVQELIRQIFRPIERLCQ